jgi:phosphoribosylanthranilate isomerase
MIVKICGITNVEDAVAAVDCGADAIGFNFYPKSPRCVTPEAALEIGSRLPAHVWKVGVFVNEPDILEFARRAALDIVQLHGDETVALANMRVWKAFRISPAFDSTALAQWDVEAFVFDSPSEHYGGSGRTFDWSHARVSASRVIVAGGLDASNVAAAIEAANPWGVDTCSRIEGSPGRKDRIKMAAFIAAAKATT